MKTKLTYETITSTMLKLCQKSNITLILNDPQVDKNNGVAFGDNEIHLGNVYSSNLILLAIFLHEYSHIQIAKKKLKKFGNMSIFREEVLSWTLAMEYQIRFFGRSFTRSQGKFMLDCLSTYSKQHYNFSKSYET